MKTKQIHFKASEQELKEIKEKAEAAGGLTVSAYLRAVGMKRKITTPLTKDVKDAIKSLATNTNQLAKAYNTTGETPGVKAVEHLWDEAKKIVRAISDAQGRN